MCDRVNAPELVHDPEGLDVELVPGGHDGIIDIEIVNATADLIETRRFWLDGVRSTDPCAFE